MTISKKLFIIGALAIGLQPIAHAYNVVGLKEEVSLISDFAEKCNNDIQYEVGYWLKKTIDSTYMTSNFKIIKISNIIKQENAMTALSAIMLEEENFMNSVEACITGIYVATCGIAILKLMSDHIWSDIKYEIARSELRSLVLIDKLQQQINKKTKPTAPNTWFNPNLFV